MAFPFLSAIIYKFIPCVPFFALVCNKYHLRILCFFLITIKVKIKDVGEILGSSDKLTYVLFG